MKKPLYIAIAVILCVAFVMFKRHLNNEIKNIPDKQHEEYERTILDKIERRKNNQVAVEAILVAKEAIYPGMLLTKENTKIQPWAKFMVSPYFIIIDGKNYSDFFMSKAKAPIHFKKGDPIAVDIPGLKTREQQKSNSSVTRVVEIEAQTANVLIATEDITEGKVLTRQNTDIRPFPKHRVTKSFLTYKPYNDELKNFYNTKAKACFSIKKGMPVIYERIAINCNIK